MSKIYKDNGMKFVTMKNFSSDGKLKIKGNKRPILLMIFGDFCPHCHSAAPDFIRCSKNSDFLFCVLQVDKMSQSDGKKLGKYSKGLYRGAVPTKLIYDKKGVLVKEYPHAMNNGCIKYEYLSVTY